MESTRLLEELGESAYDELREAHNQTIRSVIQRDDDGIVVQTYGDGFLAVFSEPSTAVARCLEIQQLLDLRPTPRRDRESRKPFRLRIGIDMGQVAVKRSSGIVAEVFGRHVNRASRIESRARPGSVLTSFSVYDSSVGWLRETVTWIHHPPVQLKGFSDPISVHEPVPLTLGVPSSQADTAASGSTAIEEEEENTRGPFRYESESGRDAQAEFEKLKSILSPRAAVWSPYDPYADALKSISRWVRRTRFARVFRRPRILWVDDSPENNAHLVRQLSDTGLQIETVLDTGEAMVALRRRGFSAVISDMGRRDSATAGLELLEHMRESGIRVPCLIFTSPTAEAEHAAAAKELGVTACTSGTVSLLRSLDAALRSR